MSFSSLRDKRDARRSTRDVPPTVAGKAPSAAVPTTPPPTDEQPRLTQTESLSVYHDFPEDTLQVLTTAQRGRGVYVRPDLGRSLKAGTTIIATSPTAAVLSTSQLDEYCSCCFLGLHELSFISPTEARPAIAVGGMENEASLFACGGCRVVRYCSKPCQSLAWPSHKPECRALQRLRKLYRLSRPANVKAEQGGSRPWIPEESVRALGKLCWERRRKRGVSKREEIQWWDPVAKLQSHRATLTPSQREPFAALAMTLAQYLAAGESEAELGQDGQPATEGSALPAVDMRAFGFSGVGEMMDLICAFATNSFTLSTPSLSPIGVSISPLIALINHSCAPNAVVVFPRGCGIWSATGVQKPETEAEGKGMRVVLIRDIQPGEEIVTSYIDVSLPRHMRQEDLRQRYHFTCSCVLCERYGPHGVGKGMVGKAMPVDPRWCMFHPGCKDRGVLAMPELTKEEDQQVVCPACGQTDKVQVKRAQALVEFGMRIVQSDEKGQLGEEEAGHIASLVDSLSPLLPSTSYPLLPLLRLHALQLTQPSSALAPYTQREDQEQTLSTLFPAIKIQSIIVHALSSVLPPSHPSLGIALAELGKLLNVHVGDGDDAPTPKTAHGGLGVVDLGNGIVIPRATGQRLMLALSTMQRAWQALQIGFGRERDVAGGVVAWEIKVLIGGLERELQIRQGMAGKG